jgi:hypothetical protein
MKMQPEQHTESSQPKAQRLENSQTFKNGRLQITYTKSLLLLCPMAVGHYDGDRYP